MLFMADWKGGKKLRINYPDADIVDRTVQFQAANNIGVRNYLASNGTVDQKANFGVIDKTYWEEPEILIGRRFISANASLLPLECS